MKIVVVQSRLDSSRLPEKALLPLCGKPIIEWVLDCMKMVPADKYFLATDEASATKLMPIATSCGWECFIGPKDDVLERFCLLAEQTKADEIIRATGDNPFLFYEAARALVDEYNNRDCDYITWTGLPHGSGVEMFKVSSLLQARTLTDNPYDHEHVGPSLYGHPENFISCMLPSPEEWNHPDYRTTVDTPNDYRHALRIARYLPKKTGRKTFTAEEICKAVNEIPVARPVLLVPSVQKGHGTGHLRRCLSVAATTGLDIYIPKNETTLNEAESLIQTSLESGLEKWQICEELPKQADYSLIVTDTFMLEKQQAVELSTIAPLVAIDEGSFLTTYCDYLLDIIPSYNLNRQSNLENSAFIPLPKNRKTTPVTEISKVLISVGGEDPANLTMNAVCAFAANRFMVTAVTSNPEIVEKKLNDDLRNFVKFVRPVENLSEKLYNYDLVVTHYGFTAFEASAAGCAVILLATTPLHASLAKKYGFTLLFLENITNERIASLVQKPELLVPSSDVLQVIRSESRTLSDYILQLTQGERYTCPICGSGNDRKDSSSSQNLIISRTPERTFRKCAKCGMVYMAWSIDGGKKYDKSYFFDDYKKQYGKTYLEDFDSIKNQCIRRTSVIDSLFWLKKRSSSRAKRNVPSVLDIGCAYGPFLEAASDAGWQVFGTDISHPAIEYVQKNLHYPAVCASFPNFDPVNEFGVLEFDAITMWYVIEHFRNLDSVLRTVSKCLKKGGIFAFSTPSGAGISAMANTSDFYKASPADHYSIWNPKNTAYILAKYGFKVEKTVSTGHHPERFPSMMNLNEDSNVKDQKTSLKYKMLNTISHIKRLGDTFEVYCVKKQV